RKAPHESGRKRRASAGRVPRRAQARRLSPGGVPRSRMDHAIRLDMSTPSRHSTPGSRSPRLRRSASGSTGPERTPPWLAKLNATAPPYGRVQLVETVPFGAALAVGRYRLANGLEVLVCEDHSAPIVAYHTWFRVGSRHEREGKTGLAHLFEHLMFNEVEGRRAGEFDRLLEEAGAESNASTWLDWTQYNISVDRKSVV